MGKNRTLNQIRDSYEFALGTESYVKENNTYRYWPQAHSTEVIILYYFETSELFSPFQNFFFSSRR